jgi:hypothetical protein
MKNQSVFARLFALSVLAITSVVSLSGTSAAGIGNITKADLAGKWNIALRGTTGCGPSTMQIGVTLNTSGVGTGTLVTHGQCGDSSLAAQTFTIATMTSNGSGTASLSAVSGADGALMFRSHRTVPK